MRHTLLLLAVTYCQEDMLDCNAQQRIRHNDIHRKIISTSKSGGEEVLRLRLEQKKKKNKRTISERKGRIIDSQLF